MVQVSKVTVREKEVTRVEGVKGVRATDPVKGKVLIGVGIWFEEASHYTSA